MAVRPPFTRASALLKVRAAQDLWNTMDPLRVSLAYTADSIWRNRDSFFVGRTAIVDFLTRKWEQERSYKLKKQLFAFEEDRIAVQFWYEYFDAEKAQWKRTYGLEHWTFEASGLMSKRHMSANEVTISEGERWFGEGVNVNEVEITDVHG